MRMKLLNMMTSLISLKTWQYFKTNKKMFGAGEF